MPSSAVSSAPATGLARRNERRLAVAAVAPAGSRVRVAAAVLTAVGLAAGGLAAMLWLLYQLASWWVAFAYQPPPGGGMGLDRMLQ